MFTTHSFAVFFFFPISGSKPGREESDDDDQRVAETGMKGTDPYRNDIII